MAEIARTILEFLKLAPRYLVAVAIMSGALLFLTVDWIGLLGLAEFVDDYRHWLGLTFLVSATLWAVAMAQAIWSWARRTHFRRRSRERVFARLIALTEGEEQILRFYFAQGTRSNKLRIDDEVVKGLVADRIIYRAASEVRPWI